MTLGAPLALLALALVPILVLLERWRRRPREVAVASLALWRDPSGPSRPPPARRRWRNLRLLLRIAALVGLTLAAADPALTSVESSGRTLYALVDRSPSMGAGDHLERAMAAVENASGRFDRVRVLFSPPLAIRRTPADLAPPAPADRAGRLEDALSGLLALAAEDPSSRVLLVTDRVPEGASEGAPFGLALVGESLPNAAITGLRVDRDAEGLRLFVAWRAFPDGAETPAITVSHDGTVEATVPGGSGPRTVVRAVPENVEAIEVRLADSEDALVADDFARARRVAGRWDLGLVTAGSGEPSPPLVAALTAVVGDRLVLGAGGGNGGIAYRTTPSVDAGGRWIVIRPDTPWRGFRVAPGGDPVVATGILASDPALEAAFPAGLPETLTLGPVGEMTMPAGARVLLRAADGRPLAATDGTTVVLAFDPADPEGDFHTSGAHPVLLRGLLRVGLGSEDVFESEGILDPVESNLQGDSRAMDADFGTDLVTESVRAATSLRWLPAVLALLAVAALLTPWRRRFAA